MKKYNVDLSKFDVEKIIKNYNKWKDIDLDNINPEELPSIDTLKFDYNLTPEERMLSYIEQGFHPYIVKVGKHLVKMSYTDDGPYLEELLDDLIARDLSKFGEKD